LYLSVEAGMEPLYLSVEARIEPRFLRSLLKMSPDTVPPPINPYTTHLQVIADLDEKISSIYKKNASTTADHLNFNGYLFHQLYCIFKESIYSVLRIRDYYLQMHIRIIPGGVLRIRIQF